MNLVAPSFRLLLRALTLVGGPIRLLNGGVVGFDSLPSDHTTCYTREPGMLEWDQHVKPERDRPSSDPQEEAGTWDLENKVSFSSTHEKSNRTRGAGQHPG